MHVTVQPCGWHVICMHYPIAQYAADPVATQVFSQGSCVPRQQLRTWGAGAHMMHVPLMKNGWPLAKPECMVESVHNSHAVNPLVKGDGTPSVYPRPPISHAMRLKRLTA